MMNNSANGSAIFNVDKLENLKITFILKDVGYATAELPEALPVEDNLREATISLMKQCLLKTFENNAPVHIDNVILRGNDILRIEIWDMFGKNLAVIRNEV